MRNPKTVCGLIVLLALLALLALLIFRPAANRWSDTPAALPEIISETLRERSLTPTPEPAWPVNMLQVTPDPDAPTPEPVLRNGSAGQNVKDVQMRLQALGYYQGELDGQYGAGTRDAVTAFQQRNGLGADGIVGSETKEVLFSTRAKPAGD